MTDTQGETHRWPVRKPIVALVGRPNVGKSALFNRMIGERRAIVEDIAGTTRDRLMGEVEWRGKTFDLIDTGGLAEPTSIAGSGAYMANIADQVERAMADADLLLFVVDVKAGITSADVEVAEMLRRSPRTALLIANKADNQRREVDANEFYELGLGEPLPVSATNGAGVGEVLDLIEQRLPLVPEPEAELATLRVAIIGRPNVGKSMLLNALLGEERVIVSEIAGTTRDAVDTPFEFEGRSLTLIDTAGIRRPGRIEGSIEHYSVMRARDALQRADIAVCVFDASVGIRAQDLHIIGMAMDANTGLVVCANKWDLMRDKLDKQHFVRRISGRLRFATWAPVVAVSALERSGLEELLHEVMAAGEQRTRRVPTAELNAYIRRAMARRPSPTVGRQRLKLLYVTQPEVEPPTFVLFVNDAALAGAAYRRYLENSLRAAFGFRGAGIRLIFRSRGEG
ncbi:MAG TPA: ribosome biogenesis GTPase Der [Dehalococcoidia bacterium]|jgi:GTP-binding protein